MWSPESIAEKGIVEDLWLHRASTRRAAAWKSTGEMRTQSPDTSPEAERVLLALLRQAPAWRKLRMVEDTNRDVKDLLMAGLRHRFPQDPPAVLRRRLAGLWLGPELSTAAYGPAPEPA